MSTLHTVNKSPFERNSLRTCLGHLTVGDAVLMIEDGVIGARKGADGGSHGAGRAAGLAKSTRLPPIWPRGASRRRM